MEGDDGNLKNFLERVLQMNTAIIDEMQQQRTQFFEQYSSLLTTMRTTSEHSTIPPSRLTNKVNIKPKEYRVAHM
jgi:hypothetical protein